MNDLAPIAALLRCPSCRTGQMTIAPAGLDCSSCGRNYPLVEGIPQLALFSDGPPAAEPPAGKSTQAYERRYQDFERARNYNLKYEREFFKRLSTRRERRILQALLGRAGRCATLLEIPCGGGRISAELAQAAALLIHADIGLGQVLYARSRAASVPPRVWLSASALRIPFADDALDAAVCIRLSHHLTAPEERLRLLRELLRVARRFVIFTFFDHQALKNRLRLRRGKRSKLTLTLDQINAAAAAAGASLAACPWLSRLGSGHRYALLLKPGGKPGRS